MNKNQAVIIAAAKKMIDDQNQGLQTTAAKFKKA